VGYLDQLKNISNAPDAGPKEPKKPQKSGCLGFLGSPYGALEKFHAADTCRSWLIHYSDRDPLEVVICPPATYAEILERHPDAVAAEPLTQTIRQPSAPLTASEETAIRAWLALIEETDPATIAEVIGQCQEDEGAREYFRNRAGEIHVDTDERRFCENCANHQHGVCVVASPGGVVSATRGYRPGPDILHRCTGYSPNTGDTHQQTDRERWQKKGINPRPFVRPAAICGPAGASG